jgi:hypothetical protein
MSAAIELHAPVAVACTCCSDPSSVNGELIPAMTYHTQEVLGSSDAVVGRFRCESCESELHDYQIFTAENIQLLEDPPFCDQHNHRQTLVIDHSKGGTIAGHITPIYDLAIYIYI